MRAGIPSVGIPHAGVDDIVRIDLQFMDNIQGINIWNLNKFTSAVLRRWHTLWTGHCQIFLKIVDSTGADPRFSVGEQHWSSRGRQRATLPKFRKKETHEMVYWVGRTTGAYPHLSRKDSFGPFTFKPWFATLVSLPKSSVFNAFLIKIFLYMNLVHV